ncbi:hypothetical protein EH230_12105 [Flavobacterium columnare]|uniref:Uncharacterized protein n=1 Tax=Flavobacterium columnare TaxID=996 RepID=A0A437UD94_9FLAO|nr:hypothetical protein [Flavobacterium columnare]RVU91582.1 hypothetical protein EH230_12105 [Flavobacterium columnare]
MRKVLIIIYLIFAVLTLLSEVILNFRETKKSICTLNFEKNFSAEKFYEKKSITDIGGDSGYGRISIYGFIGNDTKLLIINILQSIEEKYRKFDAKNNIYYEVWYNKDTEAIFIKTDNTGSIYYNGFLLLLFWIFIPFAIFSLIKHKSK